MKQILRKIYYSARHFILECKKKVSLFLFNIGGHNKQNKINLESFKNKYKGKRCFIVCTGPSLKYEDLDVLHDNKEYTFSSNRINKIFPKTKWRPSFYVISDEFFQFSLFENMKEVPAIAHFYRKESFLTTRKVPHNSIWLNIYGDRNLLEHPQFSIDCDKIVYGIATVTFVQLQLAAYMGFSEIYIIGCDNSYGIEQKKDGTVVKKDSKSHFDGADNKQTNTMAVATWEMNVAYQCARDKADSSDFTIYNATRGGYLEAFPRVSFDDLFKS